MDRSDHSFEEEPVLRTSSARDAYGNLNDMHCHLGFMTDGTEVARQANEAGMLLFDNTVTPDAWASDRGRFVEDPNVLVGFGMHPWWVAGRGSEAAKPAACESVAVSDSEGVGGAKGKAAKAGQHTSRHKDGIDSGAKEEASEALAMNAFAESRAWDAEEVLALLEENAPYSLGEVGIDFASRFESSRSLQVSLFSTIAQWAGEQGDRLLSIHAVKSADLVLDILEKTGALESCTCIFHWFSGSSEDLTRAIKAGCLFSCGARMVASGRGREYVKAIPEKQLLLETDAPANPGSAMSFADLKHELDETARAIESLKGPEALEVMGATSRRLIGPDSLFR